MAMRCTGWVEAHRRSHPPASIDKQQRRWRCRFRRQAATCAGLCGDQSTGIEAARALPTQRLCSSLTLQAARRASVSATREARRNPISRPRRRMPTSQRGSEAGSPRSMQSRSPDAQSGRATADRPRTTGVISVVGHVGYAFSLGRHRGRVFALAAAAESGDQFEHRVEGGFERFGVALDLGEEQTAL
jgi:hypothetical protein